MKILKSIALVVFAIAMVSCSSPEEKMKKYMIGNWKVVYLKAEMPSFQSKDTLVEYDIDYTNPGEDRAKSITFYKHKKSGDLEVWDETRKGVKGTKTSAKWRVTKDSLFYDFKRRDGSIITVSKELKLIEDGYTTREKVDADRDRKLDDIIYIETVRLPDDIED